MAKSKRKRNPSSKSRTSHVEDAAGGPLVVGNKELNVIEQKEREETEQRETAMAKSKRKEREGTEQRETAMAKSKRKEREGTEQRETAMPKSKRKRNPSSKDRTSHVEDAAEDPVVLGNKELNVIEQSDVQKPVNSNSAAVKYVIPHLRESDKKSEERIRLEKQIRGLLNKLSEAKVESITADIATIFQVNGRSLVTDIVTKEIVKACCNGPRGSEQHAAVLAAFIAGMSATSGIDFGANFVAGLAVSFEEHYQKGDSLAVENLASLLSHLYSFRLLPSELLYDLLAVLCKRFEELDVATILTIIKFCGMDLRGADPSDMKTFVLSIQQRTAEVKEELFNNSNGTSGGLSKRVQFMLETICDIKNNKRPRKEVAPHIKLKKWLQKLRIENVLLSAVTWKGLLDPLKKGQWWLPSAVTLDHRSDVSGEMAGAMDAGIVQADKMLQLAASQRMNTDVRRAVFCMVMSGEDYIDAFEKLLRMKLRGTQDREILRVIVECCLQEKLFNKYYSLLAAKLCDHDKNHKFTLQYCLWDHFKQLDVMELRRSANLARFLAHVIGSHSLSLAVLKAVDFTDPQAMTSKVVMHFRILLESLLTEHSEEVIWNCFSRVATAPELGAFRDGLDLFLRQQIMSATGEKDPGGLLVKRYHLANKALANVNGIFFQKQSIS